MMKAKSIVTFCEDKMALRRTKIVLRNEAVALPLECSATTQNDLWRELWQCDRFSGRAFRA